MATAPLTWKPPIMTVAPECRELVRQVARTRKLVRLHADQGHEQAGAAAAMAADWARRIDAIHGLVERLDAGRRAPAGHRTGGRLP